MKKLLTITAIIIISTVYANKLKIIIDGSLLYSFDQSLNTEIEKTSDGDPMPPLYFGFGGKVLFNAKVFDIGVGYSYNLSRSVDTKLKKMDDTFVNTGDISIKNMLAYISVQKLFGISDVFKAGFFGDVGVDIYKITQTINSATTEKNYFGLTSFIGGTMEVGKKVGGKLDVGYDIGVNEFKTKVGIFFNIGKDD